MSVAFDGYGTRSSAGESAFCGDAPRRVTVLGATGSIGRSAEDVILNAPRGRFVVESVAGGRDAEGLARVAIALGAKFAAIADPDAYQALRSALGSAPIEAAAGAEAVVEAAIRPADLVIAAIAGAAGVQSTHAAARAGRIVALANKESLVCAGGPFMRDAARAGAVVLPVDSEHNAIFQALGGQSAANVEKMILTASGGPFRTWTAEQIAAATRQQALAHPNWSMGEKVTIDSAGLMNKGLELIEAHHLFAIEASRLDVLVHPQSIVHGLVSFDDGSMVAGLSNPDMRTHIAHCLAFPDRIPTRASRLDLAAVGSLTFEQPDFSRFPSLKVAIEALREGGAMPTVLNAANEVAVEAFLAGRIAFPDIARLTRTICEQTNARGEAAEPASVAEALAVDHIARERTRAILA